MTESDEVATVVDMKKELRRVVKAAVAKLSADDVQRFSKQAQERILSMPQYKTASRIGVYLSMPTGEASTEVIVENALCDGKQVFVPYLHKNPGISRKDNLGSYMPQRIMNMVSLSSVADYRALARDKWGIPTPSQDSLSTREAVLGEAPGSLQSRPRLSLALDLIVMPGMAFDRNCNRIGHGRGFYDFFLEEYRIASNPASLNDINRPFLVALALPPQLLEPARRIPTEAHDWPLDAVVTDSETVERRTAG